MSKKKDESSRINKFMKSRFGLKYESGKLKGQDVRPGYPMHSPATCSKKGKKRNVSHNTITASRIITPVGRDNSVLHGILRNTPAKTMMSRLFGKK